MKTVDGLLCSKPISEKVKITLLQEATVTGITNNTLMMTSSLVVRKWDTGNLEGIRKVIAIVLQI
ncbi:hypothetical protein [Planococcus maritimus]|uniref:hypothetical protein n=1 Tax=Planococcus maritimus TaxID=192421 RepID=UPI00232FC1EB|nr:hypothetical protein [Planococcus maritimus]